MADTAFPVCYHRRHHLLLLLPQYVFEVRRANPNPFLALLRVGASVARLGFTNVQEALGWYIYIATCANLMSEKDPDFSKVIKAQQGGLAEHAAAPHALILDFD